MRCTITDAVPCVFAILLAAAVARAEESTPPLKSFPHATRTTAADSPTLFVRLPAEHTGVQHRQILDWQGPSGFLYYSGFACGGIAVGDVDGNGLPDLMLLGGAQPNRLYLQVEPLAFEDRTAAARLAGDLNEPLGGDGWSTGGAIFDIDNDGDLDIYICNYDSANRLYINRGDGTFDERAKQYALDIIDASLMPSICDFDRDGDIDIYLAVNRRLDEHKYQPNELFYRREGQEYLRPEASKLFSIRRHPNKAKQINLWIGRRDRLLRNEGAHRPFTDVTDDCMTVDRGDTLAATWWDYDHDGWPDLYVCNDLAAPDALHHNNGDGTFTDVAEHSLPHTPWSSMGASAGDVNNDGLVDFLAADMAFRTHFKDKVFMGDMTSKFATTAYFPGDQQMRNALFINTGTPHFQEAACNLAATEWTWTAKLADLDLDGRIDAFFTNGTPVNLSTPDAPALTNTRGIDTAQARRVHAKLPPVLEQNLAFRNAGNLRFEDCSAAWGIDHIGMSYAAAHVDLDRDGDLDLVVANLDENVAIYRNDSSLKRAVTVRLRGTTSNSRGIGAEVTVVAAGRRQIQQCYPVAGFLTCQEAAVHFGLGDAQRIEQLTVAWPSGAQQQFEDLAVDRAYEITEPVASFEVTTRQRDRPSPLWQPIDDFAIMEHHEEPYDDFARQPLLPNKLSQLGPPLAVGDVDGDGDQDLFVGEGAGWMGMLYLNDGNGRFTPSPQDALAGDASSEDAAATLIDVDRDGDLDLYVGSGSVECQPGDAVLADRLYLNDSRGNFRRAPDGWLPEQRESTGAVAAGDFDEDGDVDLLVGSRSIPGEYPLAPEHRFLRNDGGRFVDALQEVVPEAADAGMITAAIWSDVSGNGRQDLLVATDWGPIRCYENQHGKLVERTAEFGLAAHQGWWRSLAAADLDGDGDNDLVVGNFGLNHKYKASPDRPVRIYYGDYGDGQPHLIEASYEDDVLYPLRGKSCSSRAMPFLSERFPTYEMFAQATLAEIYTSRRLDEALRLEVNALASGCFINRGDGTFEFKPLPIEVQLAPVFAIALGDFDGDRIVDAVFGQNFFGAQRETGQMDGGVGVVALGNGDGTFRPLRPDHAGLVLPTDVKALALADLDDDGVPELLAASNDHRVAAFRQTAPSPIGAARRNQTSLNAAEDAASTRRDAHRWLRQDLERAAAFVDAGNGADAIPLLRRALKVAPRSATAQLMMANAYRETRRFADARQMIDLVALNLPAGAGELELEVQIAQGRLCYALGRYDEAVPWLRKAVAAHPQSAEARYYFGETLLQQGCLVEAEHNFQAAHAQDFRGAGDRLQIVKLRRQAARKAYREALRLQRAGQDEQAAKFYRQAIFADSQHQAALNNLAWLLATTEQAGLRDRRLAALRAEQANEIAGGKNPAILDTLAHIYALDGNFTKAAEMARKIVDLPEIKNDQEQKNEFTRKIRAYLDGKAPE